MKTILLVTYETSPYRGSEASVSWNYITHMSPRHHLIVIYGRGKDDVEDYLKRNEINNVEFKNAPPQKLGDSGGLLFDIKYNLFYRQWHKSVFVMVQEIIKQRHIDVVHYLNPIGFKEPGYLWKLNVPYVWGPIQGVANRPFALYPALSLRGKVNALVRFVVHNSLLRFSPRVRRAMKKADFIFTAVPKAKGQLQKIHGRATIYLPENGIIEMHAKEPVRCDGNELRLIWIGCVDERKAIIILLDALRLVPHKKWHLNVVGKGPLEEKMKQTAKEYGIDDHINWGGRVPRAEVFGMLKSAHLHVISSLGEGNPTTLWEAMSLGVPTMTLDHCGMSAVVCEKCGIKISIKSYSQVVKDMAANITNLIEHPDKVELLSRGVLGCSKKFMWDERIKVFDHVYDDVIAKYQ